MSQPPFHEDQLLWQVNRCLSDAVVKSFLASGVTILAIKLFYPKTKAGHAAVAGIGIGMGMAYLNCERELKTAMTTPCAKDEKKKRIKSLICDEFDEPAVENKN